MRLRGQNPVYKFAHYEDARDYVDNPATYMGVATKSAILLGIVAIVAMYASVRLSTVGFDGRMLMIMILAPIIAIVAVIATHWKPEIALFTTMIYALAEGMFIGVISALYAYFYGGEIVQMALMGTFGVLAGMLFLYSTGIIRVGDMFRKIMFSMLMGLVFSSIFILFYAIFGGAFSGGFYSFYVGIVVLSVIISSLYLLVDFDNITRYVQAGVPKNMEWSLALGLVVTIIWLYIELLRFIAIIMDRR